MKFCEERGLRIHGHTLVWNLRKWAVPDWMPTDPDEAAPFWEKRIKEIAERYGSRIKRWDVVNEVVAHYERHLCGLRMQPNYEAKSFEWAEKHLPSDARLDINETTGTWGVRPGTGEAYTDEYIALIERLLAAGRQVGAIGLQFHLFNDDDLAQVLAGETYTPELLFSVLDRHADFQLPLHVSEITLTAPDNFPEGLEAQALVARNFYRLWFSHPLVEGIT